jgi:hypothetical protein
MQPEALANAATPTSAKTLFLKLFVPPNLEEESLQWVIVGSF